MGISAVLSGVFGVLLGIAAAWRRRTKTDYSVTAFTMATYSMPDFWLGMLLLTPFAVVLGWFPVGGIEDPASTATGLSKLADQAQHMFLPALTLTLAYLGEYAIVMRSSLLDTMREDYLVLARAKGLRDVLVRNRHAVPNALLPVVALLAINFGFVLSGAIAVEAIFSWPGPRAGHLRGAEGPRPADAPGAVPRLQRLGDLLQPGRRPALRLPRPAGEAVVSAVAAPSARAGSPGCAAGARSRAPGSEYRAHRPGMIGLVILVLAVLMALAAPLLADESGLRAINTTDNPTFASPSEFGPLGTDNLGRDVMTQFIWGARISLLVGLAATLIAILIGSIVGIAAGFFGGKIGGVLMRVTEWFLVIPFLPLAIVLAAILGPSVRNIILVIGITSWPQTARLIRAQVLTLRERDYVDRSRALGALELAPDVAPHPPQRLAADPRQHDAHGAGRDPLRGHALVPRPRRPVEPLLGEDARRRVRGGRGHAEAWWYILPPGIGIMMSYSVGSWSGS